MKNTNIPTREELWKMASTHTIDKVADIYGVSERAAYYWFEKNGLKPLPKPRGGSKKLDIDFEYVKSCIRMGIPLRDIAETLHVCEATISTRIKEEGLTVREIQMDIQKGTPGTYNCQNQKRKRDCIYWHDGTSCCDYIIQTGHRRPCPPHSCTEYKKGKRPRSCERDDQDTLF